MTGQEPRASAAQMTALLGISTMVQTKDVLPTPTYVTQALLGTWQDRAAFQSPDCCSKYKTRLSKKEISELIDLFITSTIFLLLMFYKFILTNFHIKK